MAYPKGKKRGPQSPQHIAKAVAAKQAAKASRLQVLKSDALAVAEALDQAEKAIASAIDFFEAKIAEVYRS